MKKTGTNPSVVEKNREVFLETIGTTAERTVLVQLDYDSEDFCRYRQADELDEGNGLLRPGLIADGILTKTPNLALFLPLADCIGAVLYDPDHKAVMLSHLGRHNLEQYGGKKSIDYMVKTADSIGSRLLVWFSPSAGQANYPMHAFDGRSLEDVAREQLISAGVSPKNITSSNIDTTTDTNYFSHSEFLRGHRATDGRFAVVAMLKG